MKKIQLLSLSMVFSILPFQLSGQGIKQGEWRDHLSYFSCDHVVEVGDWIYASAGSGLVSFNKNSLEISKHSKATGLSDVQVSALAYAKDMDYLIVGYANGNIDLLREGEKPFNISDIKRRIMTADKKINSILVKDDMAYLSCGFGIVVLNLEKLEIKETYILGESGAFIEVYDVAILDNLLYAGTETGIVSVDLNSPNLLDYHYWTHLDALPDANKAYYQVESYNNKIFAAHPIGDTLDEIIYFSNGEAGYHPWTQTYVSPVKNIQSYNGFLTISCSNIAYIYNQNELLVGQFNFYGIRQVILSEEGNTFFASDYGGLLWHMDDGTNKYLLVNGPRFSDVSKVATLGDEVWVSSGGPNKPYKHGGVDFINSKGEWISFTAENVPTKTALGNTYKIAIDPKDPKHVFVGTYGYGIIEFRNEEIVHIYELDNTDIFADVPESVGIRVVGIQFDQEGNLYFILDLLTDPLFILDNEGNWHRPEINNDLLIKPNIFYTDLLVTEQGQIWIVSLSAGAVAIEEESEDYYRSRTILMKNQYGNVLSRAYCAEEDKEGNIWIGTTNGPIIFYSPQNIFDASETNGYQVPIPRNDGTNIIDPLLFSESVFDIVTDGGNRKWIATDHSGVFLISDDGKKTLENFTEENSPLLSDGVTGIGINEVTGEVFFATDLGLISYGGIATEGLEEYTDVYVYPNPVRPDYQGPITITGLVSNTIVKITDVSGNLVWETNSLGGQATWDGKNFRGDKVATGVYLVLLATEDGSKSHVTKLLFLH